MLDGRLSAAMALGAGTRVFADIGADHGRLSAALLLGGAGHGLVSDVSAAALEKARRRLCALGLEDRATFAVADGLDALSALEGPSPDTIFVLGMGGGTVCGILKRGCHRLCGASLVLGAQTDLPMVRRAVSDIGYRIRREQIAPAGGRDYVLMRCGVARPGEAAYTEEELWLGPVLLRERPAQWRRVLERRERILQQEISAMQRADLEKDKARLALSRRELGYVARALEAEGKGDGVP